MYQKPDFVKNRPGKILELADTITPIMNELHGVQHNRQFWLHILGEYLKTCVNREGLMSAKKIQTVKVFLPVNSWQQPTKKQVIASKLEYVGRMLKHGVSKKIIFNLLAKHNNICIGSRAKEMSKHGVGYPLPSHFPVRVLFYGNNSVRKKLHLLAGNSKNVFISNVLKQIPVFYAEGFKPMYDAIVLHKPQKKVFHLEHLGSPFDALLIAKYQASGAKLFAYQTGGFMGEWHNHPDQVFYEMYDKLITYGWQQHPKDEPGKPYRLMEYKDKWQQERNRVGEPLFDCMVVISSIVEQTKDHYKEFSTYFLQNIDREQYPRILYRPRPKSKYLDNKGELKYLNLPESVQIDAGMQAMAASAARSELVIQTWLPSTNFLECIYVNQPVVALNTNTNPSFLVKPFLAELGKLGVVHSDVTSLVEHLNGLDVESWWNEVKESKQYKEFRRQFAGVNE